MHASSGGGDLRLNALELWLESVVDMRDARLSPASVDASFRRYFRLSTADGTRIVMDAPPGQEDSGPFVRVAAYLASMGINAPRVLEADLEQGFLLLTDLGSTHYLEKLAAAPAAADELYADAIDALVRMQVKGRAFQDALPPYDERLLRFELSLFHDWLCERHLGLDFAGGSEQRWQAASDLLVASALEQPRVFVHRDYHSRNLMVTAEDNPGVLDFQDAVEGPLTYDLVSLLKDCYIRFPDESGQARLQYFLSGLEQAGGVTVAPERFERWYVRMGVQRHLKAAGIFARLNHRDGKPGYMADIPRTLGYIVDAATADPDLAWLAEFVASRVLPRLEPGA